MDFHYINTNDKLIEGAYKKWLRFNHAFTNGDRKYGETLRSLNPGDVVFMYVSEKGVKAVGMVIKKWDGIDYREQMIPCKSVTYEYRIPVQWFIVVPDGFVSPSEVREILGYDFLPAHARIEYGLGQTLLRRILQMI